MRIGAPSSGTGSNIITDGSVAGSTLRMVCRVSYGVIGR